LQGNIGSLWVSLSSLGKLVNAPQPMVNLREEPRVKLMRVTYKATKIAVPSADF